MRLIDADTLKQALKSNCTPELCHDYNTGWCEHCCPVNDFEDLIDNAPTVEGEILTKEAYSDLCLRASKERPQGEWVRKEDVIHSIEKQYSEHNELVPIWLSIGDMRGEEE